MRHWLAPALIAMAAFSFSVPAMAQEADGEKADPYKVNPFLGDGPAQSARSRFGVTPAGDADEASPEAIAAAKAEMAKPRTAAGYVVPRLAIGQPDLQGVWSNASNTRLTRPAEFDTLVMGDEEAAEAQRIHPQNVRQATDDNQKEEDGLLNGRDLAAGRGYNAFWIDPGSNYARVKDTWRTSWIVDPPSGQIPHAVSDDGGPGAGRTRRGNGFDNPEERNLWERCIAFSGGGPPLMNGLYNNNFRISQSPTHVIVEAEMIHDTRIIRLNAEHLPDAMSPWYGDSIGWWEGDTLVVETVNINPKGGGQARISEDGKIIERFTRYDDRQVLYEFEIHDPTLYSQVWKGEVGLNASPAMYEYACHEGNYGLEGILAGGRANDRNGTMNDDGGSRGEGGAN